MPNDHYISQTYLRRFIDPQTAGLLQAYRKSDGKHFQCRPRDVCTEWDGDLNPKYFPDRPKALGEVRGVFEPLWNPAVEALSAGDATVDDIYALSLMMANFGACTPAARRNALEMAKFQSEQALLFSSEMSKIRGHEDDVPQEAIDAIKSGRIYLEFDEDWARAVATTAIPDLAWSLFHQDWYVVHNESHLEFLTSDNPLSIHPTGPGKFVRHLAITPQLCILVPTRRDKLPDKSEGAKPLGSVRHVRGKAKRVKEINEITAMCADDLVFSSSENRGIARLVQRYKEYSVNFSGTVFSNTGRGEQFQVGTTTVSKRKETND